ncbi:zinc finger BED domain-containing protein 4-like isoform X1 [Hyla sarda]|uniref:zinc finger BED domain-containing protein 4-like isoform X1 n=1 Tax=Hyla sarda TaxID=327740 RepID=UPI0024C3293E|nr:zinc finger BED domain-containing protein 4-like isoform X1 [Hyla sarda]XP_056396188.1 zinc finger BED domain-containing protein 4-like isoform X1 [Hyla sarda]
MVEEWLGEHGDTHPKMGFVLTNGAAKMIKALRNGNFVCVRCSAHVLHLVVKAGLEDTSESNTKLTGVLDSCRKIAGHFHRSVKDSHLLRREQSKAGVPQHRLKQDVSTRWNSTLEMLERILEQQKPIHAMSHENYIGITRAFGREEWTLVAQVVAVLSPFRAVTEKLSQEKASLAQVIPLFTHLLTKMDAFLNNREKLTGVYIVGDVATLVRRLQVLLQRRIKELTDTCPDLMLATMCDPRIKGKMALQANALTSWRDKLIIKVCDRQRLLDVGQERHDEEEEAEEDEPAEISATISNTATTSSRAADFWAETLQSLVGQIRQPSRIPSLRDKVADMVKIYVSEPNIFPTADAMKYWDEKRAIWPALSMVAQELLSCPPTSVQSEQVFSVTGNILCPQRSQLSPQLMEQMTFFKVNLPKLGYPALNFETS